MHLNGTHVADLVRVLERDLSDPLEYTTLPSGDVALLRSAQIDPEPRYVLTQKGRDDLRRALAMDALFGPWPTVAQALEESTS